MSAGTCATVCCTLLFVGVFVSAEQETITAESGQNVTLTCRAPNNNQIRAVVWTRPDLADEHVYLYRDGRFDPGDQNPVYRNRVELQDSQMKDGDVSLILKDVAIDDTGRYECRIIQRETSRSSKTLSIIYLSVSAPPAQPRGSREDEEEKDAPIGLIVCLSVSAVLSVAAAAFFIYRKVHPGFKRVSTADRKR